MTIFEGFICEYIVDPVVDATYYPITHGIAVGLMTFGIVMLIASQLLNKKDKGENNKCNKEQ